VLAAPWGIQFDAYRNKLVRTWRPGGNRNPLHRLMIKIGKKQLAKDLAAAAAATAAGTKAEKKEGATA
jgi:hypothetical protein